MQKGVCLRCCSRPCPVIIARPRLLTLPVASTCALQRYRWLNRDAGAQISTTPSFQSSLKTFHHLRTNAIPSTPPPSPTDKTRVDLHNYHSALVCLEGKGFPIEDKLEGTKELRIKWGCAFDTGNKAERSNLRFERLCILFNAASVESHLGALTSRSTEAGLKRACHSFQTAAGMYTEILNLTSLRGVAGATIDLSEDCLNMCVNLTLAQGQACVYEKAVRGRTVEGKGVKPSVLAKIAQSAGDFYAFSLKSAKSKGVGKKLDGSWENNLNSQAMHFYATAQYWESVNMRDVAKSTGSGYGVEIARLTISLNFGEQAVMFGNKTNADVKGTEKLMRTVRERIEEAERDNRTVYLEPVPKGTEVSKIKGATLVKPLGLPNTMTEPQGNAGEIFASLLPKLARGALEKYQKTLEESIEATSAAISNADSGARASLQRVNLPGSLEAYLAGDGVPEVVWSKVEGVQRFQPRLTLTNDMRETEEKSGKCRGMIVTAVTNLDATEKLEREFKADNREYEPEVKVERQMAEMRRQISHYQHLLDNASNSDAIVKHNLNSEGTRSSLALLERSKSQLDSEMPSKDPSSSDSEKIDTAGLQTALMELTKVMAVRAAALKHFKDTSGEFDMSEKLSEVKIGEKGSTKEDYERVVDDGLAKFDEVQIDVQSNIESQDVLLKMVFEENQRFQSQRKADGATQLREAFLRKVEGAVETFESLRKQLVEGKNFYESILVRLTQIKDLSEDQKLMVSMWHGDYLSDMHIKERSASQEETDAALAKALAEECGVEGAGRSQKEMQERADAEFAARLLASEEQEAENAAAAASVAEEEEEKAAKAEKVKAAAEGGMGSMFSSWWGVGEKEAPKSQLSQSLTANQYPAAVPSPPSTANSTSSTHLMASSAYSGGGVGDAPPVPLGAPPPVFREQRSSSYEPPSIGGGGAVLPPPGAPPPSFDAAMRQMNTTGGQGTTAIADEAKVRQLTPMGFGEDQVRKALVNHNNDLDLAMNELLSG